MKRNIYHIACSWVLLICFVAGQGMIYAHRHAQATSTVKLHSTAKIPVNRASFKENCSLCDVMHHNAMLASSAVYLQPVSVAGPVYREYGYEFNSIQPILAAGRAPPSARG